MGKRLLTLGGAAFAGAALVACAFGGGVEAKPAIPAASPAPSESAAPRQPAGGRPSTLNPDQTVIGCTPVDGVELAMDVYFPDGHTTSSNDPALVYVHGGGWTSGGRTGGEGIRYIPALLDEGFVVFAVDYRLAPDYQFPAQIQDVQCAIRGIRAAAATYGIDADRIGAIGGSAGGQLVNLLGTAEDGDFPPVGGNRAFSSEVSVVVDMYGASDFSDSNMAAHNAAHTRVFGADTTADEPGDTLWQASAVNYVSPGDADFLILHGEEDPVVPISQSERLEAALLAVGGDVTLVRVHHAGHGFVPAGGTPDPGQAQLIQTVARFFTAHL
jgi:acetyl esterase/lipase